MATYSGASNPARERNLGQLILQADGLACAALSALLLAGASPIAAATGLPIAATLAVGALTLPYGIGLFLRSRTRFDRGTLLTIASVNVVWVVASALLLLLARGTLTTAGTWAIGIVALLVADLAAVQFYAARKAR